MRFPRVLGSLCIALVACQAEAPAASPAPELGARHTVAQPLTAAPAPAPAPGHATADGDQPIEAIEAIEEILDERDACLLHGRRHVAPPNSDFELRYSLRLVCDGVERPLPADVEPGRGARLAANGTQIVVARLQRLLGWVGGGLRVLDGGAEAGFDIDADGAHVAYAQGEMPFFGVRVVALSEGEVRELLPPDAPRWLPFFSVDGQHVLVTAVAPEAGVPGLARIPRAGGPVERLTNAGITLDTAIGATLAPTPTGPRAPLDLGSAWVFETDAGVVAQTPDGRVLWSRPGTSQPRWRPDGRTIALTERADRAAVELVPVEQIVGGTP